MDNFTQQFNAINNWAEQAHQSGWINQSQLDELKRIELQTADDLFAQGSQRPLIVALFGGTGAGKSSLLNRLAGESIATVGVERPTSHEVTLYLHQAYQLGDLPQDLPTEKIKIQYHNDDQRKLIAWLDMPDIDSTETKNRQLVEAWLPYIDWLVYVMTPERYQDDIGWRFLQQRSHRHHWLFVLNHWDEASLEQLEDLRNKLIQEKFTDPVILRTSCITPVVEDDFQELEQTINNALEKHGLDLLKQIGLQARLDDLKNQINQYKKILGTEKQWEQAHKQWTVTTSETLNSIQTILNTQSDFVNQTLLQDSTTSFNLFRKQATEKNLPGVEKISSKLWSHRIETLFEDLTHQIENQLQSQHLPARPFGTRLENWRGKLQNTFNATLDTALTTAIAKPGNTLQRASWKLMRWLSGLLPLAAAGWVITHVVQRFYTSTQGTEEFLGSNFAVHSALLIGLSWFIPWLIKRQLQPSVIAAARKGIKSGIQQTIKTLATQLENIWDSTREEQQKLITLLEDRN
ncbi:MAG TPA: hypothetical protein EYH06_10250 [Chromatiales bacterium]|nr:hypothetical protein [Thiotrichales bacterium]HIP68949.1 hypothetical protein [Chromatiales bacterium]